MQPNPFHDRQNELSLYGDLSGVKSMLELGNKRNGRDTYKAFFEAKGIRHVSVDWNGKDGALKLDLTHPLRLGTFDMVTNIGTTEHVCDQVSVWRNVCEALHVGSRLVSITPLPGDWLWHGEWYPSQEWYLDLAYLNELAVEELYTAGIAPRRLVYFRGRRLGLAPFVMPERGMTRVIS